jgi:murein DD-endopeptidase MepM/ murein hydrolase activator NlpD
MSPTRSTAAFLLVALVAALSPGAARAQPAGAGPWAGLLAPERLRPGDPLLVWAISGRSLEGAEARLLRAGAAEGQSLAAAAAFAGPLLAPPPRAGAASSFRAFGFLLALPADLPPGGYRVLVRALPEPGPGAGVPLELSAELAVEARAFPSEDIPLDAANSRLLTETDPRKVEEARRLYEILGRADADAVYLDGSAFMIPLVPRRRSAGFGDRRRYLYADGGMGTSLHGGMDLAVAAGTEVWACAPGRVILTADRAVTGLTVVVEHLPGLYSIYMHLSAFAVAEGQVLERGAVLGRSGSTGLSTGPHLHWELRAAGQAVDPEFWLSRPPLDKDRAAAIMMALIEGR